MHNIVQTYRGHCQEVCGLKYFDYGKQLLSRGNDNMIYIWDQSMASPTRWLHQLKNHTAAARALAWCPFQSNLLASGGSEEDQSIKFWNTQSGVFLNSYPSMVKQAELSGHTSRVLNMAQSPDGEMDTL
ncbi:hypothetical protein GIB67_008347 [Kingdonia uniflora]|uniref:Uncharacterized protein n=1 Tax=Kingdonia uniflora TaxID=39325 RepID=A0A7J7N5M7_9MAGN|nr:hypothetical protein GIB67_008347 [Kingdonia uniflora]